MIFEYIVLIAVCAFFCITGLVLIDFKERSIISNKTEKFVTYATVLEYHMQKAYDIIYKDRMLIFSVEATKVSDKEFGIISKDFGYLVLKMLGPNLTSEFTELYGNEETLLFNIIEYFNTRNESDAIREKARENLLNESKINDEELVKKIMI